MRKAKEQIEPKLLMDIKGNRKGFYSHSSKNTKSGENVGLLPNVVGDQVMGSMENTASVKDFVSSLPQPLLARSAAHSQVFQIFA